MSINSNNDFYNSQMKININCHNHGCIVRDICAYPDCKDIFICQFCRKSHQLLHHPYFLYIDDVFFSDDILNLVEKNIEHFEAKIKSIHQYKHKIEVKVNSFFKKMEANIKALMLNIKSKIKKEIEIKIKDMIDNEFDWKILKQDFLNKKQIIRQENFQQDQNLKIFLESYIKIQRELSQSKLFKPINNIGNGNHPLIESKISIDMNTHLKTFKKNLSKFMKPNYQHLENFIDIPNNNPNGSINVNSNSNPNNTNNANGISENSLNSLKSTISLAPQVELNLLSEVNTGHDGIQDGLAYIEDFHLISTAGKEGTIKLWDSTSFTFKKELHSQAKKISKLLYVPEKKTLLSFGFDKKIKVFKMNEENFPMEILEKCKGSIISAEYIPSENKLITGESVVNPYVKVWDLKDYTILTEFPSLNYGISSIKYIPKYNMIAAGLIECGKIYLLDIPSKTPTCLLEGHNENTSIWNLCYHEKNDILISGGYDRTVRYWALSPKPICIKVLQLDHGVQNILTQLERDVMFILTDKEALAMNITTGNILSKYELFSGNDQNITTCGILIKNEAKILVSSFKDGLVRVLGIKFRDKKQK